MQSIIEVAAFCWWEKRGFICCSLITKYIPTSRILDEKVKKSLVRISELPDTIIHFSVFQAGLSNDGCLLHGWDVLPPCCSYRDGMELVDIQCMKTKGSLTHHQCQ